MCGGNTDTTNSCSERFDESHIVLANGVVQRDSGGTCTANEVCDDCNTGFFSSTKCKPKYGKAGFCDSEFMYFANLNKNI